MLQSAQLSTDVAPEETADKTADRRIARRSEELHLRNFDVSREHTLTVRVSDDDGLVFANRYYLTPGKTVSELGRIPPESTRSASNSTVAASRRPPVKSARGRAKLHSSKSATAPSPSPRDSTASRR
ncbi:hypothetical protein [Halovenus salina]|uniref:Ig-like domain-containing protein n=1 Tax=Halovenus salina TaxID=1510225 RepID=A0ABD5W2Y4_9EURY